MSETAEETGEPADGAAESAGEAAGEEDESVVRVLKSPDPAAEPLESLVEGPDTRVIDREVARRLEDLSDGMIQAREKAQEIVDRARQEADQIREEAREEGRQEGYEEVLPLLGKIRSRYKQIQDEAEQDTLELAFRIARRIIGHQIEVEPEVVREMISESLEHVRGKRNIVVHVNPEDFPILESHREAFARDLEGASIYFEENENIERGGCVIETEANRVDARLKMQLKTLKDALKG